MVGAKLDEGTKERKARNFRQVLDFGCVCLVQELDGKIHDCNDRNAENLVAHLDSGPSGVLMQKYDREEMSRES